MGFLLKNNIWPLTLCLNLIKIFGFLVPGEFTKRQRAILYLYQVFWFVYLDEEINEYAIIIICFEDDILHTSFSSIYIIVQAGDLLLIWGNVPLMVSTSFLLFTNVALGMKTINVMMRGKSVQNIIDDGEQELVNEDREEGLKIIQSCNKEVSHFLYLYITLTVLTVLGWAASAEKSSLPLRAWYPFDISKSPAFEITYFHQVSALYFSACLNVSLDTLATCLTAVCRCRLKLLNLALVNLCQGDNDGLQTEEEIILPRLKSCVRRHQAVLKSASEIQRCFSEPILAQFTVSMVIICVTAYQLAVELHNTAMNVVRIVGMTAYLFCMILQVFLYCYQGNQLVIESTEVMSAAYTCPWYSCSLRFRRSLLIIMIRSRRQCQLTAGGFTTLSLACFTAIVKASYTFFTVLQRVEDRQK